MSKEKYSEKPWFDKLPDSSLEVHEENFNEFFRTMFERQEIWYKRFTKQPQPWTEDKILRDNRFTSIYRELDRQSQFLLSRVIIPYGKKQTNNSVITQTDKDIDLLYYYIIFFKLFNNYELFEWLKENSVYKGIPHPDDYDPKTFEFYLTKARKDGVNPFTSSYLSNSMACVGKTRDYCFSHKAIPDTIKVYKEIKNNLDTPEDLIKLLETITSVSSFLSHEFYQDFTYIPRYTDLEFPFTQDDYTNLGPGAEMGVRLIFPNRKTRVEKTQAMYDLRDLSKDALKQYGYFKYLDWNKKKQKYEITNKHNLTLHSSAEFWLCEFQKYWKMCIGQGKQRSSYKQKSKKEYNFYLW